MRDDVDSSPRRVLLVVFPGFQLLDATGPASALGGERARLGYRIEMVSSAGGLVESACGVCIESRRFAEALAEGPVDTMLVAGGERDALAAAISDADLRSALAEGAATAKRFGSVCSGVFLLAACGLIKGRRVATHWEAAADLARLFPDIEVDAEALFVRDGRLWTSAGVSTGIDMTLALVEEDHGAEIANLVAQRLVLYARRPGQQSQFSPLLKAQRRADAPFQALIAWMRDNLSEPLDAPRLASKAGLSERSFYRRFTEAMGEPPARHVERLRLDAARVLLEKPLSLKEIAAQVGFGSAARMTAAFERRLGVAPSLYRQLHARPAADAPRFKRGALRTPQVQRSA